MVFLNCLLLKLSLSADLVSNHALPLGLLLVSFTDVYSDVLSFLLHSNVSISRMLLE